MNPPPPYPATRSQGFPALPLIEESDHRPLGRPGRLAPKWLEDFISGNLQDSAPLYLDVGCASLETRKALAAASGSAFQADSPPVVRHVLLVKGHQCSQGGHVQGADAPASGSDGRAPGADGKEYGEIYSCVCQNCRYHFTFYFERSNAASCGMNRNNYTNPFHHLVFNLVEDDFPSSNNNKYYPFWGRSQYICSARDCGFKVTVEVSLPRLSQRFLSFLTDNDRINTRLLQAKQDEPERYADVAEAPPNALHYLRIYLQDVCNGSEDAAKPGVAKQEKKISIRNKKFHVHFGDGPEAEDLLTFLEFSRLVDGENRFWKLPTPDITRPTRPGSQLAFYQDIKSEIETILGKESENLKPTPGIGFITAALDIEKYATSRNAYGQYSPIDYDILGILPEMHESIFWYAFSCQRQVDPSKEPAFFHALQRLATARANEELEMKVQSYDSMRIAQPTESLEEADEIRRATEESLKELQPVPSLSFGTSSDEDAVNRAYVYFGLSTEQRSDDDVLGKFESLYDGFPSQKSQYREKLLLIARHTGSKRLKERALEDMDLAEALTYLGVESHTEAEYIVNVAQFAANSGEKDYVLVATALRAIGRARNNDATLLQAATFVVAAQDQSYQLDYQQYANEPSSQMDLDTVMAATQTVNYGLPVGLQNIRNTCYLNSILQYFFTVKPIREIVLNMQEYGLENTEENLERRRIDPGSTRLDKGDAYAGQQFVIELAQLFGELLNSYQSATKPPQRLALAALKNPGQLEADGAKILEKDHPFAFGPEGSSGKESPAPPLPARHAPAPPPVPPRNPQTATKVVVNAVSEIDAPDSSSSRSSQTLVNQTDDGWQAVGQTGESSTVATTEVVAVSDAVDVPMEDAGGGDVQQLQDRSPGGVKVVFDPPPTQAIVTVEEKIERALNDSSVTGTDQQDVEEVMGNIIGHLRAAVRPTGEDEETGAQRDPITDLFFWTSVTYNRSNGNDEFNRQVSPNRWVTAYPDEGGEVINLLQALDNNFHREFITQGSTRYERFTSILKLPPILHVHIQRTTRDGGKNNTAIQIPSVLYLDRFMDSPVGSELFKKRRRAWNLQERLRSLQGPNGEVADPCVPADKLEEAAEYTKELVRQYLQDAGSDRSSISIEDDEAGEDKAMDSQPAPDSSAAVGGDDDYFIVNSELKRLMDENGISLSGSDHVPVEQATADVEMTSGDAEGEDSGRLTDDAFVRGVNSMKQEDVLAAWSVEAADAANALLTSRTEQASAHQAELDGLFSDLKQQEYLLHAVICHAGQTGKSGHYWVWVFDFDRQLWRRYNDSTVTEEPDTDKVMRQLSTQGEPYYLAYVRAQDVNRLVEIPVRTPAMEEAMAQEADAEAAQAAQAVAEAAMAQAASHGPDSMTVETGDDRVGTIMASVPDSLAVVAPTPLAPPAVATPSATVAPHLLQKHHGQTGAGQGPLEAVTELDEDA